MYLKAELFSCADGSLLLRDTKHRQFFSSLIDGCLKYKNKEKPKTGPRPGPRLNYDVKIGPKPGPREVKKSGPVGAGLKCRALAFPSVEITFPPRAYTILTGLNRIALLKRD